MEKSRKKRELTVERHLIDWFPAIDEKLCLGCRICVEYCFKQVFQFDERTQKAGVINPYECVVLCSGCRSKCPNAAISFPTRSEFEQFVRYVEENIPDN